MPIEPSVPTPTPAMPATTTRRRPRRSPLLAPLVVGLAGLVVGGALAFAIAGRDDGGTIASAGEPADDAPAATEPATSVASTAVPTTTVDESPLRAGAARVDGATYLETAQCVAFPLSDPWTGVGDAHVNVSLHRVESTDGRRLVVERWNEDGFVSVGVVEPGGRSGRSESVEGPTGETAGGPETVSVTMDDGSTILLEHTLVTSGVSCATTVVQGADEFTFDAFGAIDVCQASDASGLGSIVTFQDGSMLQFREDVASGTVTGALHAVRDDGSVVEAELLAESSSGGSTGFGLVGAVTPGYVGDPPQASDTLTAEFAFGATTTCLPAQEAAFASG